MTDIYDEFDLYEDSVDFDSEFEDFADNSGFLTNFSDHQLQKYQSAILAYSLVNPSVELIISTGWNCKNGLYLNSPRCDLSEFWELFDSINVN